MKFSFKFSNLLGAVYKKGNLVFTPDGNSVISPVGNRITVYDLKNSKSYTLPVENRYNFQCLALSPNGSTLVVVDEKGSAQLISMISKTTIYTHFLKSRVSFLLFSPDGKYLAICKGNKLAVFKAPGLHLGEYNPFILERSFLGPLDEATCMDWTSDSRVLAVGSKDTTVRIYGIKKLKHFRVALLAGHADVVVGVYFEENSLDVITVSRNGRVFVWEANLELSNLEEESGPTERKVKRTENEDEIDLDRGEARLEDDQEEEEKEEHDEKLKYTLTSKNYVNDHKNCQLTASAYHKKTHILVLTRSTGEFLLYEMPDVNLIHSLTITDVAISTVSINSTGDWIALGCESHGQLLVWEWQSETYVLKQQAHAAAMSTLCYSGDGQYIATGGEDGKVKLWNTLSGFCFVTFTEHTSAVTSVKFARNRKFLVSASLDGTVRAFDMMRYRNFRTFTSTRPVQFASLAIDSSCEFVAAGGQDVFEIFLWSMKVGRLLEILSGHEGPVVSLDFHPGLTSTELASVSWDGTLRIWNAVEVNTQYEAIRINSDCLSVTYRPNGEEVAVASLDGQITIYEPKTGRQNGFIEGKNDLSVGRSDTDLITAKRKQEGRAFTCLCFSADGDYILAAGQSKYICIYNRETELIIKKIEVTQNRSFDAVDDFINRRKMTEFGNKDLIERRTEVPDMQLPGAKKGDMASRTFKPEIRVFSVQFSPTGQSFAAATTEGLLIYSLDAGQIFDPYLLEEGITPDAVLKLKEESNYTEALMMSLKLNEEYLIRDVIESFPSSEIDICSRSLAEIYIHKILSFVANTLESTQHFQFYLLWTKALITRSKTTPLPTLLAIQKNLIRKQNDISKICEHNKYSIEFLLRIGEKKEKILNKVNESDAMETENEDDLILIN